MVLTQELVFGTINSNTGSGTKNNPVIIQGNNINIQSFGFSYSQMLLDVPRGTIDIIIQADNNDSVSIGKIVGNGVKYFFYKTNPNGEYKVTINISSQIEKIYISTFIEDDALLPFTIKYYWYPLTLNWVSKRPRYSNNALVFYKSGTANGAVGSVVNSRVISRRT